MLISLLSMYSCKKDYPTDIPDWVIKEIKDCKKHKDCCNDDGCLVIEEYRFKDSCTLYYYTGFNDEPGLLYDISGEPIHLSQNSWPDFPNPHCRVSP